ncbi:MAG: hypothetical protein DWQ47_04100 [Acidobacteria bacterium]|nr:MAG: hypothetical protein DWQ32_07650 [Acidobacteriota bacterium]REK01578.1 MAG: hypothetical protein DWQ38_04085 [Acidobacteriota bacterium]REK14534.1 MAG: hypothetical protein DWQ43_13340 [Acidobacteriota bacterium]REK45249.1 MAG: hypothetical protein DWQ47_04100 [Acidobacteriota bacterium]
MKNYIRTVVSCVLLASLSITIVVPVNPCGPADLIPVFENDRAPEFPYNGFADGELGIVSAEYPRIVLFAAYRYMAGSNFTASEREELTAAWMEFYSRKRSDRENISEAVKAWVSERASVIVNEEAPPDIYVDKPYSETGYQFFPNCSTDAFVVARETLSDRAASHGSGDKWVQEWIRGQDTVFRNCADSKASPTPMNASMPEWLKKDRAYQTAAAEFYSLNYAKAKELFGDIAKDPDSPWQEVSEYLVPRTIVREASLTKNKERTRQLYSEAEQELETVFAGGGKYSSAAEKLLGLVKYRLHPEQRVQELAQNLSYYGGSNLKQDLIDYTWLLAKFEAEALEAEERRKEEARSESGGDRSTAVSTNSNSAVIDNTMVNVSSSTPDPAEVEAQEKGWMRIYLYNDDYSESWVIWIDPESTDEEVIEKATETAGPLTQKMIERLKSARQSAYQGRYGDREEEYQGHYWGDEETSLNILPPFLMTNDLTEWLFTFQIEGEGAYLHSLNKYRQTNSDAWLVAAVLKANKGSRDVIQVLEGAKRIPVTSPAFPTAAYHRARLLLELDRPAEAKTVLDEILNSSFRIPISARNELSQMRMGLADSLGDFIKHALRKPFAFEWGNSYVTIDELIEEQKGYYEEEYYEESREEYERSIEEEYRYAKSIQGELMLTDDSISVINYHFPFETLLELQASDALPEYLRSRLSLVIWTRAVLLDDWKTADFIAATAQSNHPELHDELKAFIDAATPAEKKSAALFAILKNERITPFLAGGFGTPLEGISYATRWWCEPYSEVWSDSEQKMVPVKVSDRPPFLTAGQSQAAFDDMKKLKALGGAPKFLAESVLSWQASAPNDPGVPEGLFITWQANGWDKYGCEGDPVDREKLKNLMMTKYPRSPWTQKMLQEELQVVNGQW